MKANDIFLPSYVAVFRSWLEEEVEHQNHKGDSDA